MCLDIIDTSRRRRVEEQSIDHTSARPAGHYYPLGRHRTVFRYHSCIVTSHLLGSWSWKEYLSIHTCSASSRVHYRCTFYCPRLTEPGILPTVDTEEARSDECLVKKVFLNNRNFPLLQFRAKYCKELKVTIERFDHFCPWTGNGVGIRNYHLFFYFLVFTMYMQYLLV